jgi:transposase, IS5 family
MPRAPELFDLDERLAGLSRKGDALERLAAVVDFELFWPDLERAVPRADRAKGGRPPFDHVLMFKVLILQTQNNLSDERTEFYRRDRLTWMRFLGLGLGDAVPDANTTKDEKAAIKAGRVPKAWQEKPAKLRQKDRDARWTVKDTKAKPDADGKTPPVDLAILAFGYQNHISADRRHRLIQRWG